MHLIAHKSPSSAGNRRFLPYPIPCLQPAALAALGGLKGRRKCATFSPRAWRGDERARRVLDGVAAGLRRTMPVRLTHRAALAWVVGWG